MTRTPDKLNEEDVTAQVALVLDQLGAFRVRRLGNYILLDVPAIDDEGTGSQAFNIVVSEICK